MWEVKDVGIKATGIVEQPRLAAASTIQPVYETGAAV